MTKKNFALVIALFFATGVLAQGDGTPGMADAMRQNGLIYVVVTCLVVILVGFFIYLIITDRKINKIKKHLNK